MDILSLSQGIPAQLSHLAKTLTKELQSKIICFHNGIDTDYFQPNSTAQIRFYLPTPLEGRVPYLLDLSGVDEIVTAVGQGITPYRGFVQFMKTVELVQKQRPNCHFVFVGDDDVAYGKTFLNGQTYRQTMLSALDIDQSRLHFTGHLPPALYRQVLQASSAHMCLTSPFMLSRSMLEAMSTGCLLLASDMALVQIVIQHNVNGLLANFFQPEDFAYYINNILDHPDTYANMRLQARQTIVEQHDLHQLLSQYIC